MEERCRPVCKVTRACKWRGSPNFLRAERSWYGSAACLLAREFTVFPAPLDELSFLFARNYLCFPKENSGRVCVGLYGTGICTIKRKLRSFTVLRALSVVHKSAHSFGDVRFHKSMWFDRLETCELFIRLIGKYILISKNRNKWNFYQFLNTLTGAYFSHRLFWRVDLLIKVSPSNQRFLHSSFYILRISHWHIPHNTCLCLFVINLLPRFFVLRIMK